MSPEKQKERMEPGEESQHREKFFQENGESELTVLQRENFDQVISGL